MLLFAATIATGGAGVRLDGGHVLGWHRASTVERRSTIVKAELLPLARVESEILVVRRHKVILDADLAELYGVQTKALSQTVRRNPRRFPEDFMFRLTREEARILRSQIVTSRSEVTDIRHVSSMPLRLVHTTTTYSG
jgi:hypothetical protein